jgi:hypothetical protein
MPGEVRLIIFDRLEVLSALTEYRRRRGKPLPPSDHVEVSIRSKPRILVDLAVVPEGKQAPIELVFDGEELAAALIMFCIDRKIPMPAAGVSKSIRLVDDSIALQILKDVDKTQTKALADLF